MPKWAPSFKSRLAMTDRHDSAARGVQDMIGRLTLGIVVWLFAVAAAPPDTAARFGARPSIEGISLSPDGTRIAYLAPRNGQGSALYVAMLPSGTAKVVTSVDGTKQRLSSCNWVSNTRLACYVYSTIASRLIAFDADSSNVKVFYGEVLEWSAKGDGVILVTRYYAPTDWQKQGLRVERVDTVTGRIETVQADSRYTNQYITDGIGNVRMMGIRLPDGATQMIGATVSYFYNKKGSGAWLPFSRPDATTHSGVVPLAVDPELDVAYALEKIEGRQRLIRIRLDGSLSREVLVQNPTFDVDGVVMLGRTRRIVGAEIAGEKREVIYFDPTLKALVGSMSKALPALPIVDLVDASADGKTLLIWAGSDTDPGRFYAYYRPTRKLNEIMLVRPDMEGASLAKMMPIQYRASDGTMVPAYLSLPQGSAGKNLPALVMPHGGPSSRDEWGFDWLVQYFVSQGFAVLQPEFRGSSGFGEAWFKDQGFVQWRVAMRDVADAGHYLVAQGIADPAKLAIFGWSYGGYAALQVNAVDPDIFRAIVAVAPVTDIPAMVEQDRYYTDFALVRRFLGTGVESRKGSPTQNADRIKAPVLIFQGEDDANVSQNQAKLMDKALARAGKRHELVLYPKLDHQLEDSAARIDMLARSTSFLRSVMGL